MLEIIPVLDIRRGIAVSGKSGRRSEYKPLQTVFAEDSDPVKISKALPFERLYLADLDGIMDRSPDLELIDKISSLKDLMIDPGIQEIPDLLPYQNLECDLILGTETIKDREVIFEALRKFKTRLIISIDIFEGKVISRYFPTDPIRSYKILVSMGIEKFIFLNISNVGTGQADFSFIKGLNKSEGNIFLGGGITENNLEDMEKYKVDGVLIGTALHQGRLEVR